MVGITRQKVPAWCPLGRPDDNRKTTSFVQLCGLGQWSLLPAVGGHSGQRHGHPAWTLAASELWLAVQRATAPRARGRLNAAVLMLMLSQGAMAAGGIVWGAAQGFGSRVTLLVIGGLFLASLALACRWSLDPLDLPAPQAPHWAAFGAESLRGD
jgi:hypothetical protein